MTVFWSFCILHSLTSRQKGFILAGVTNPDYHKETEVLLYNGRRKEFVQNSMLP